MDLHLTGRVAVVTGADSGIGLQTAVTLAAEGATVLMTDRDENLLQDALKTVRQQVESADVHIIAADLTIPEDITRLVDAADKLGDVAILAHLAGERGAAGDFIEITDDGWRETLEIDLLGAVRVCRAFIPGMLKTGYGRIVLTASENAVQPYTQEMPYDVCKAGIVNLGKALSKDYGRRGVHVNVVSPAFIQTPMTDAMMEQRAKKENVSVDEAVASFLEEERPGITLQRRGTPQEVANVIAFLCSDVAMFVDGSNWRVDGGAVHTAFS